MTDRPPLMHGLPWRRRIAGLVLWIERIVAAFHLLAGAICLFVIAALFDLPRYLPTGLHIGLLLAFGALLGFLVWHGWSHLVVPHITVIEERLEADSGLTHHPLSVLRDKPSASDPFALAIWREHQQRSLQAIRHLRVRAPRPVLAQADKFGTRHAILLGLVIAVIIAGSDGLSRLTAAVSLGGAGQTTQPEASVQAWITPPAYTGLPPLILRMDQTSVSAPKGSRLTVAILGAQDDPSLMAAGMPVSLKMLDHDSHQAEQTLVQNEEVVAAVGRRTLASWHISVVPDHPPVVAWGPMTELPANDPRISLPWHVTDDYGVTELHAELRLKVRPDSAPLVIGIPLPMGAGSEPNRAAHGVYLANRLAHPWAGFEIVAILVARDGADQTGMSEPRAFTLPEQLFRDEIARDLIQARKTLTAHPDDHADALDILDHWLQQPERFEHDQTSFLLLASIYGLMVHDKSPAMIDEAQSRLWDLAVRLEEKHKIEKAAALEIALKDLREELEREALREAKNPCPAIPTPVPEKSPMADPRGNDSQEKACSEQERKAAEARKEMDRALSAILKTLRDNKATNAYRPTERQDMEQQLNEALEALRDGRLPEARAQIGEMLRSLEARRGERRENGNASRDKRAGPLQDMVDRETALLERSRGRIKAGSKNKPDEDAPTVDRQQDQRVQRALGRALDEAIERLRPEIPPPLVDAREAMALAQTRLSAGDDNASADAEKRAIDAMRRAGTPNPDAQAGNGGQEEGQPPDEALAGEGDGPGDDSSGLSGQRDNGDPLGREAGTGTAAGSDVPLPDQPDQQRNRIIRDELRHRDADRQRPDRELDYLDNLLKSF